MNPFTLKELRQLTRSRTIAATLMIFLFAFVFAAYIIPLNGINYDTGADLVSAVSLALMIAFTIVLPLNIFIRMHKERRGKSAADLTLMTPLPPAAIIDGKLRSAYALMFLLSSAALPFFVAAYLLHGITFVEMFKLLAIIVVNASLVVHTAIAIASMRTGPLIRTVLFAVSMLHPLSMLLSGFVIDLVAHSMPTVSFIELLAIFASLSLLLRAYAVAFVSPRTMERDFMIRGTTLALAIGWLVYIFLQYGRGETPKFHDAVAIAVIGSLTIAEMVLFRAIAQDVGYSRRQLASRPAAKWRRLLRWPFASGAVNGIFFATVLILALGLVMPLVGNRFNELFRGEYYPLICSVYILALALYFRAAWYQLKRFVRIPPTLLPVGVVFIFAFLQTLPAMMNLYRSRFFNVARPFFIYDLATGEREHLVFALTAFALGILAMLPETIAALKPKGK